MHKDNGVLVGATVRGLTVGEVDSDGFVVVAITVVEAIDGIALGGVRLGETELWSRQLQSVPYHLVRIIILSLPVLRDGVTVC